MRYPKLEITEDLVKLIIQERIKKFLKSSVDIKYKNFISKIDILPCINNRQKTYYGFAFILPDKVHFRRKYKCVSKRIKTFKFENKKCFAVLEICSKTINNGPMSPINELRETISHELAHILEMKVNGEDTRSSENNYHGIVWQRFAKQFGCKYLHYNG